MDLFILLNAHLHFTMRQYYSELIKAQIEPIDHLAQLDET